MEIEHDVVMIKISDQLEGEIEKLRKQGWMLTPGAPAVAIYHIQRVKGAQFAEMGAAGGLGIDDSKIMILRDGKLMTQQEADADARARGLMAAATDKPN